MICTIAICKGEDKYVAKDIVSGVVSQGDTIDEARSNLKEALELYYEDIPQSDWPREQIYVSALEIGSEKGY